MKAVSAAITEACKEKTERDRRRGIKTVQYVRWLQESNVGKSAFIWPLQGKPVPRPVINQEVTKRKTVDTSE